MLMSSVSGLAGKSYDLDNFAGILLPSVLALVIAILWLYPLKYIRQKLSVKMANGKPSSSVRTRIKGNGTSHHIATLIEYARSNSETNPTNALTALLEATAMNSGRESANLVMDRLRSELGDVVADHIQDVQGRREQAVQATRDLVEDDSTVLAEGGRQDILRQAMEDGSSVLCTRCKGLIPAARWQQHQRFWCEANENDANDSDSS
uniref:C2HC zinc finger plants domain-containing protein n=1 Tax=Odontella aurita TaxID=265563 RepID=A0A7S4IP62_9STRA|mmetsp:Transcript_28060/g.82546  ORF Transcript_28060/g.82546 Transcript_28060/m.82546 type:complete len:207 (+) Transcript_28060:351-971(+)